MLLVGYLVDKLLCVVKYDCAVVQTFNVKLAVVCSFFGFLKTQVLVPSSAGILETYWDKHSVIASTPPPSPTSGESGQ